MQQFEVVEFTRHVLQDDSVALCAILGIISSEWAPVIDTFEIILRDESQVIGAANDFADFEVDFVAKQTKYLRENREMLKGCLAAIQAQRTLGLVMGTNTLLGARSAEIAIDFEDFILQTEDHILRIGRGLAVFASMKAIEESRKAIRQTEDVRYDMALRMSLEVPLLTIY